MLKHYSPQDTICVVPIVALVVVARSFPAGHGKADQRQWAEAVARGGLTSGLVVASSVVIGVTFSPE